MYICTCNTSQHTYGTLHTLYLHTYCTHKKYLIYLHACIIDSILWTTSEQHPRNLTSVRASSTRYCCAPSVRHDANQCRVHHPEVNLQSHVAGPSKPYVHQLCCFSYPNNISVSDDGDADAADSERRCRLGDARACPSRGSHAVEIDPISIWIWPRSCTPSFS